MTEYLIDLNREADSGEDNAMTLAQYNRIRQVLGITGDFNILDSRIDDIVDNSTGITLTTINDALTDHINNSTGAHTASAISSTSNLGDNVESVITTMSSTLGVHNNRIGDLETFRSNTFDENDKIEGTAIANDTIITRMVADGNVTTDKIANGNVTTAKIANENVTTDKIANENVTTDKIANENVTTAKIADEAVTTDKIADENVTTDKIDDEAVTLEKLAPTVSPGLVISLPQSSVGVDIFSPVTIHVVNPFSYSIRLTHAFVQRHDNVDFSLQLTCGDYDQTMTAQGVIPGNLIFSPNQRLTIVISIENAQWFSASFRTERVV